MVFGCDSSSLVNQFFLSLFFSSFTPRGSFCLFFQFFFSSRPKVSTALFFQYNTQLGPPYHILLDTNFINFSIKFKLDIIQNMMDCLYAKCIPYVTDCVMGEMEKLGRKYRVALKILKDIRFERLTCMHSGTYADDCLVQRVTQVLYFMNNFLELKKINMIFVFTAA